MTEGIFWNERLKEMVSRYAANPSLIIPNGHVNEEVLETLVSKHISIHPKIRSGYACIKGTRIAVCDIICDSQHLTAQKGFEKEWYGGTILPEAIDAAFAFFMRNFDKVAEDYNFCYGKPLPQELYV